MAITREDYERLEEIRLSMLEMFGEAKQIVRGASSSTYERAKAYWLAQVEMALTNDHSFLGSAGVSMEDTIKEIEPDGEECASCLEVYDTDELVQCDECKDKFCEACCELEECADCKNHC